MLEDWKVAKGWATDWFSLEHYVYESEQFYFELGY